MILIALLLVLFGVSSAQASQVSTQSYGVRCNGIADDTDGIQAAINAAVNSTLFIQQGSCIITRPLVVPSSIRIMGEGEGSGFSTAIRPVNTTAFVFSGVHHSTIEHVMIWPKDGAGPVIEITNGTYSVTLQYVRVHLDTPTVPSVVISVTRGSAPNNDLEFHKVVIRSTLANTANHLYFGPDFGTATLSQVDLENSDRCVKWEGGHLFLIGLYTEVCSVHAIHMETPLDPNASLAMIGGFIHSAATSSSLGIRSGARNIFIQGTWILPPANGFQIYTYGLVGSHNINIQLANPVPSKIGAASTLGAQSTINLP